MDVLLLFLDHHYTRLRNRLIMKTWFTCQLCGSGKWRTGRGTLNSVYWYCRGCGEVHLLIVAPIPGWPASIHQLKG